MRMRIALALVIAVGALEPLGSSADDLFQMFWRVTCYSNTANGRITVRQITERDFIRTAARNNGLNPADLVFVYRPNKRDTAVVRKSDGAFVADVVQMELHYTDVTNPPGTFTVRHALLHDEEHEVPLGSFFGVEKRLFNPDGSLANDSLSGRVMYSKPEEGTVCSGTVATGRRIIDRTGA